MQFKLYILRVAVAAVLANLAACGYIKSLFPDKEKDYQYTTEIKPLVLPPNLSDSPAPEAAGNADPLPLQDQPAPSEASAIGILPDEENTLATEANAPIEKDAFNKTQSDFNTGAATSDADLSNQNSSNELAPTEAAATEKPIADPSLNPEPKKSIAELVVYKDGETRLQVAADKAIAWRKVGKALSRNSIEVVARDLDEGSFNVLYDPNEQKFEDSSLWDEVKFIYGGVETHNNEYLLKLIEFKQKTDVAILDHDGKPTSNGAALSLLKLLQQTINTDQTE